MTEKYFVSMHDPFFSDWRGTPSENKKNILVFECENKQEAEIVAFNAVKRGDQENIKIHKEKPRFSKRWYYVQQIDKNIYPNWYNPNADWG